MRKIDLKVVSDKVRGMFIDACENIPENVLDALKKAIVAVLEKLPPVKPLEFEEFNYVKPDRLDYEIFKEGETFVIVGSLIDVIKRNVVMDDMHSLAYLHKVLRDRGIIKELRKMGATDKSTVIIGGEEFEFVD